MKKPKKKNGYIKKFYEITNHSFSEDYTIEGDVITFTHPPKKETDIIVKYDYIRKL